jgi:hypothetical protein
MDNQGELVKKLLAPLLALCLAVPAFADPPMFIEETPTPTIDCDCQQMQQWHLDVIHAKDVWPMWRGDSTFKVAIIGPGIDLTHDALNDLTPNWPGTPPDPDASFNVWRKYSEYPPNGIDNDSNGKIDDYQGWDFQATSSFGDEDNLPNEIAHTGGTGVATIIAGLGPEWGYRGDGICPHAKLVPLKICQDGASGAIYGGYTQVYALTYARQMGCKLAYLPLNSNDYDAAMKAELNAWDAAGGLVVVLSGQYGINLDTVPEGTSTAGYLGYPTLYTNACIVSVLETSEAGQSILGAVGHNTVDLAAPERLNLSGPHVYSSSVGGAWGQWDSPITASAEVTGAIALVWSKFPAKTGQQIKTLLLANVDRFSALNNQCVSGGRLNVYKFYMAAAGGVGELESAKPAPVEPSPSASASNILSMAEARHMISSGTTFYDAAGRRVTSPKPGIYFVNKHTVVVK